MLGKGYDEGEDYESHLRGIQPRVLESLFEQLENIKRSDLQTECLLKASYFEIYNEQIMDLVIG